MMIFFFPQKSPEFDYDIDIRYWEYEDEIILAVAFIPSEECDEATANAYVSLAADSIEISFEYNAKMYLIKDPEEIKEVLELEDKQFISFFLLFSDM